MRQGSTRAPAIAGFFAPTPLLVLGLLLLDLAATPTVALAGTENAALPDDRLGIRTAPLLLLSRPDVRADLGLTPQQADSAERAITDLYVRAAALRGKTGAEALQARKAIDDAQRQWIEASLTPDQRTRLLQIDLQWEGPSALVSRPVVADTLVLTPDQRQAIQQAITVRNSARAAGQGPRVAEEALAKTVLSVLAPNQKARWHAMLGRPFTPQLASSGGKGVAGRASESRPR
jgi:hypothetical protein